MSYVIGLDVGTTRVKAILYNDKLQVIDERSAQYRQDQQTQETELDPRQLMDIVMEVILPLQSKTEKTILSLSVAMHSLLLVDYEGNPLTNLLLWNDLRATEVVRIFKETDDWQAIYHRTMTPVHPMSPFAKLLWFKQTDPLLYKRVGYVFDLKSWLMQQLCGVYVVDYAIASATGLWNAQTLSWDNEILKRLELGLNQLPQCVDVAYQTESLDHSWMVCVGGSDGALANIGAMVGEPMLPVLSLGTSGAIRQLQKKPYLREQIQSFCYYADQQYWIVGAPVNNGGNVLEWLCQLLYEHGQVDKMLDSHNFECELDELFCLPFLFGERAPYWDGSLTGSLVGMQRQTTREQIIQAVLEGVLMNLFHIYSELYQTKEMDLVLTGGLALHPKVSQMIADLFGCACYTLVETESGCFGAAMTALQIRRPATISKVYSPSDERHHYFQKRYQDWLQLQS